MKLQLSRRLDLAELAETVVSMHSPQNGSVCLDKIIEENDIKLHTGDYAENFDAVLIPGPRKFHIHLNLRKVNGDRNAPRARFSIAHELGHYLIDEHRTRLLESTPEPSVCGLFDSNESNEENEADHFAANLIMPPSRFQSAASTSWTPLNIILNLAREFDTSLTATALQFMNHVSDRSMVIRWKPDGEMAWAIPGSGYKADGYRAVLFKDRENLPKDSASARVMASRIDHGDGVLDMATVFQNVAHDGQRNLLVTEEAIALGDYGFMTILSDHKPSPTAVSERAKRRAARKAVK
jgi:Zn-dependent peptidase ImmA (M78 family)